MTSYFKYHVSLSDGQKRKLAAAIKKSSPVTLGLGKDKLHGQDELMLTQSQIKKIQKAKKKRTGVELAISNNQIRKSLKHGGNLFFSLAALGAKVLPLATKYIPKVAAPLATGAVSALGSLGIDKLLGSEKTKQQEREILSALRDDPQVGGMLGTVLASFGIPFLLKVLTGSGLKSR